jgi:hypothetical protein
MSAISLYHNIQIQVRHIRGYASLAMQMSRQIVTGYDLDTIFKLNPKSKGVAWFVRVRKPGDPSDHVRGSFHGHSFRVLEYPQPDPACRA